MNILKSKHSTSLSTTTPATGFPALVSAYSFAMVRSFSMALAFALLLALVAWTPSIQAQSLDLQPPVLQLEEIPQGIAGETQVFSASVEDDRGLTTVILYHRLVGDEQYASTEMLPVAGTTIYSASMATTTEDARDIEYYVQAEDTGGNKAIKGFAFDPLVRDITADFVATASTVSTPSVGLTRNRKILYGALGVLAIGLLASQGGGSGGSGQTTGTPVNIDFNQVD